MYNIAGTAAAGHEGECKCVSCGHAMDAVAEPQDWPALNLRNVGHWLRSVYPSGVEFQNDVDMYVWTAGCTGRRGMRYRRTGGA